MGKGPKATEKNVSKQLDYRPSSGSAGGSKKTDKQVNKCLLSLSFDIYLNAAGSNGISASMGVILVLASNGSSIDVHIAGSTVGAYSGLKAGLIVSCMKQNYIYEGVVTKVKHGPSQTTVSCDITGHAK